MNLLVFVLSLFFSLLLQASQPKDLNQNILETEKKPKGSVVSSFAGGVAGEVLSTRDVLLSSLLEDVFYRKSKNEFGLRDTNKKSFVREADAVLLEHAIWIESKGFPVANVEDSELNAKKQVFLSKVKSGLYKKIFEAIQPTNEEISGHIKKKLAAKKIIKFKVDAAAIPVADDEAKEYYKKNKFKFNNMPFENIKDSIKNFLSREQVEERMQEWFSVLRVKYRIENQLDANDS